MLQSLSNNGSVAKYVAPRIKKGLGVGNHNEEEDRGSLWAEPQALLQKHVFWSGITALLQALFAWQTNPQIQSPAPTRLWRSCYAPDSKTNLQTLQHCWIEIKFSRASENAGDYELCPLPLQAPRITKWNPNCCEVWSRRLRDPVEKKLLPNLYHVLNLLFSGF